MSRESNSTPAWQVIIAWVVVGVPMAWGIYKTLVLAKALFV